MIFLLLASTLLLSRHGAVLGNVGMGHTETFIHPMLRRFLYARDGP